MRRNNLKKRTLLISIYFNLRHFFGMKNLNYLNSVETINDLLENNKSLIRWGDGETALYLGKDIEFQKSNKELSQELQKILDSYCKKEVNFLLAAPNFYLKTSFFNLYKLRKHRTWFLTRYVFGKKFLKLPLLGDAFIFRPLSTANNNDIERLWLNNNVVLVNSDKKILEDFKIRYPSIKVSFIKIENVNAFSNLSFILEEIQKAYNINNFNKEDTKILISAGPTAKIILSKLCVLGYIGYDMGHYFTWKFYGVSNSKGI